MTDKEQDRGQVRIENKFFPSPGELRERLETSPQRQAILDYLVKSRIGIDQLLIWPEKRGLLLSDLGILRHFLADNIVINPFNIENLTPNSYDVTLDGCYYRQEHQLDFLNQVIYESPRHLTSKSDGLMGIEHGVTSIFNPWDSHNVDYTWRRQEAVKAQEWMGKNKVSLEEINPEDEIIMLNPHEMILARTQEFIGGRNVVSTTISARSTVGRSFLEVCNDANLGHIGFINFWTLEIKNKSDNFAIPLLVGQRYAQISFFETEPSAQSYQGEYQTSLDLERIKADWRPEMMLPKMRRRETS